jgi:hypothetical protein
VKFILIQEFSNDVTKTRGWGRVGGRVVLWVWKGQGMWGLLYETSARIMVETAHDVLKMGNVN